MIMITLTIITITIITTTHDHVAAAGIASVSLSTDKLIDPEKLLPWLNDLTQARGPDILRLKGIFAFPDEPKRFVVQGVHMILEGDTQREWREDETRVSRLVFIGQQPRPRRTGAAPSRRARRDARGSTRAAAGWRSARPQRSVHWIGESALFALGDGAVLHRGASRAKRSASQVHDGAILVRALHPDRRAPRHRRR